MESNNDLSPTNKPDNYLVWAILSTFLCCVPFGIVSIVYSTKVDSLWERGDYVGATEAAKKSKMWMLISVGCGILACIIAFAAGFFAAIAEEL